MSDNADMKSAQQALQTALKSLEGSLSPILSRLNTLETEAKEAGDFSEDRAKLAAELDAAKTDTLKKEAHFQQREAEFMSLASETTEELDRVIAQVRGALGQG